MFLVHPCFKRGRRKAKHRIFIHGVFVLVFDQEKKSNEKSGYVFTMGCVTSKHRMNLQTKEEHTCRDTSFSKQLHCRICFRRDHGESIQDFLGRLDIPRKYAKFGIILKQRFHFCICQHCLYRDPDIVHYFPANV